VKQLELALADPPRKARTAALRSAHFQSHVPAGEALAIEAAAGHQDAEILDFFRVRDLCADRRWTPSEVHAEFPQFLLTSIRRSLTNLTRRGLLLHHPHDRRSGPRGARESCWSLRV
jgi:hypothetical protein